LLWGFSLICLWQGGRVCLPPIKRLREPAGRVRETFWRPEVPSGKAKVRSLVVMLGAGIFVLLVMLALVLFLEDVLRQGLSLADCSGVGVF